VRGTVVGWSAGSGFRLKTLDLLWHGGVAATCTAVIRCLVNDSLELLQESLLMEQWDSQCVKTSSGLRQMGGEWKLNLGKVEL
jgi:hypothetical protein